MKKRRTLIISLLLIAALALGIGYAALSTDLTVSGSVSNAPHPIDVTFQEGSISAGAGLASAEAASRVVCTNGAKSATFDVAGLVHQGDKVVATFTVVNNNKYAVTLNAPSVTETDANDFFTATTTWLDADGNATATTPRLASGETATFQVTVTMDKNTAETYTGDFVVTVTATSAE